MNKRNKQFRIEIKCDEPENKIRYEEPFTGLNAEALRRAKIMWARTSYVANVVQKTSNRDVYAKLEVWDTESQSWRIVWEKRGKYPLRSPAPAQT
jgi:hypothetical protein